MVAGESRSSRRRRLTSKDCWHLPTVSSVDKALSAPDWSGRRSIPREDLSVGDASPGDEFTRDAVFERALTPVGRDDERLADADLLLSAMLLFDSLAYAEHVLEALDCHSDEERRLALDGFRFFGLQDVADLVESIAERVSGIPASASASERERHEEQLIAEYERACCDGLTTRVAFEQHFARRPQDFAAPSSRDVDRHQETIDFTGRL